MRQFRILSPSWFNIHPQSIIHWTPQEKKKDTAKTQSMPLIYVCLFSLKTRENIIFASGYMVWKLKFSIRTNGAYTIGRTKLVCSSQGKRDIKMTVLTNNKNSNVELIEERICSIHLIICSVFEFKSRFTMRIFFFCFGLIYKRSCNQFRFWNWKVAVTFKCNVIYTLKYYIKCILNA